MSTTRDLDGYWMARCSIEPPPLAKPNDDMTAELFIVGPPNDDGGIEGIVVAGIKALENLKKVLDEELEMYEERIRLSVEDIPQ